GACVTDAKQVKGCLEFPVLPLAAVKAEEGNIRQAAELDDIWPQEAVRLIRAGSFYRRQIRLGCPDIARDLQPVAGKGKYVFQIFRRIFQSEENIQEERVMPFFYEGPAYSCC